MKLRIILHLAFVVVLTAQLFSQSELNNNSVNEMEFIKGADVSLLLQLEDNGGVFKENGIVKDPIQIFKDHGLNYIRLKIWHSPTTGYDDLSKVLLAAQRIKNAGLKFLLDFHYSDIWADPGNQSKPAAWNGISGLALKDSIYNYTKNVITTLKNHNLLPDMVQIGNEIICGMLWNDGRICEQYNTQQQWANLGALVKEGIRGVNESLDLNDSIKIMIHIDRGGDNGGARWFFDGLLAEGVQFDIIGLSYYPWWQGTFNDLQLNLTDLAQRYGKDIIVVETAYPWTLAWNDNTNNIVGNSNQLLAGYPATVDGQKKFLVDLMNIVNGVPNNKGVGVFYWEPDWITTPTLGSPWENLAMFDFSGEVLNSIYAFDSTLTDVETSERFVDKFTLYQNYPNPFNPNTTIRFTIPEASLNPSQGGTLVKLTVYNILGQQVAVLVNEVLESGVHTIDFNASELNSGMYLYKIEAGNFVQTRKMTLVK